MFVILLKYIKKRNRKWPGEIKHGFENGMKL